MDKETEKMFEILTENKERQHTKKIIEQQIESDRKIKKHQNIRTVILFGLMILVGIVTLFLMLQENEKFVKNCVESGLSENVCRKAS